MFNESCRLYERYENTPSAIAPKLYYYVQWAGHFICNADFYIDRQNFPSILLLQTLHGSGKLYYRGSEYVLTKDNYALINCRDAHTYFPCSKTEWSFQFLHFTGGRSTELYEHIYDLNEGCLFKKRQKIEAYLSDCMQICKEKGIAYEVQVSKKLSDILHEILLNIQQDEQDKIAVVCDYIAENYTQELTTAKLAELSCLSRCYFSTVFKKATGCTLHDYLLRCRLDRAKSLLMEDRLSIGQVAEQSGFNDVGTFIRAFKKKEKVTPLQYKKAHYSAN